MESVFGIKYPFKMGD